MPKVNVALHCGHSQLYDDPVPLGGEEVYCRRCGGYSTVERNTEVRVRCGQCRLSRGYGADLVGARSTANKHVVKNPTHTVSIMDGGAELERVSMNEGQESLPFARQLQERAQFVQGHQQLLKNVTKSL